ncbi:MAG: chemotaxis-specific protein-glutamate methyltransferase CheB [Solirubrobacteraceae bacterium]|nr:chemotaxis-specific protein-glutamate methyltransferase CheB [Solirubrobacteraceae bacterium]
MSATTTRGTVVVADDSRLMRRVLSQTLRDSGYDVVGEAEDGDAALQLCRSVKPDVMTLDLAMPGLDGMGVLRTLRRDGLEIPVVVVSAFSPAHGARAVDALAEGAFDLIEKPKVGETLSDFGKQLDEKVFAAAGRSARKRSQVNGNGHVARVRVPVPVAPPRRISHPRRSTSRPPVVVIATSTGGPRALAQLMPQLPSPLGAGVLIVQHMPPGFTNSLAQRLDNDSPLNVVEAQGGERIEPGRALLAPGGSHLHLADAKSVRLGNGDPVGGLRPRADLTIEDVVDRHGANVLLVVLTGMGNDGLAGARAVKAAGGRILVEAEDTCAVYGMPRAIAEAGLADVIAPLHDMPAAIAEELS